MRLDRYIAEKKLVSTRSQAEQYIKLGKIKVNGAVVTKAGHQVTSSDSVLLASTRQYVSRAAFKLASFAKTASLQFHGATVLDVGSSTGGFTDYVLQHGALRVVAVDVGTNQMKQSLRHDPRIELHEQTDIRNFRSDERFSHILVDVSFISLRAIIQHLATLAGDDTTLVLMAKPQFEAHSPGQLHKGVVKNNAIRRRILHSLEQDLKQYVKIIKSADSKIAGEKGNIERFYLCNILTR